MLKIKPNARRLLGLLLLTGFVTSCSFESVRQLSGTTKLTPFEEIKIIGGENTVWGERYHPFIGATSIDIDGDGMMEIYVSGGDGFDDMLYRYRDNALVNIIDGTGLADDKVAHGANSIDLDDDGDTDLLLARNDGVFLYVNNGGVFSPREIPINSPADSEPLNVAVGDIDGDGDGDLYVSFFVMFPIFAPPLITTRHTLKRIFCYAMTAILILPTLRNPPAPRQSKILFWPVSWI